MGGRPNHGSQIGECEDDGSGGDPIERVIESGSGALLDTLIDALTLWLPRRSICLELTNHFDSLSLNRLTVPHIFSNLSFSKIQKTGNVIYNDAQKCHKSAKAMSCKQVTKPNTFAHLHIPRPQHPYKSEIGMSPLLLSQP